MWEYLIGKHDFFFVFYNFLIYSVLGWIYESVFLSIKQRTLVNRGFLNGPIIPIYGFGATLVYLLLYPLKKHFLLIFMIGMVIASLLEFITSYILEKVFHARWWDYSNMKYNIQGRVSLSVSAFWGLLSVLMMLVLQPIVATIIDRIPINAGKRYGYAIIFLLVIDLSVTVVSTLRLEHMLEGMQKLREDISQYIEGTRIYGTTEDVKAKLANLKIVDMAESLRSIVENYLERFDKKPNKVEFMDKDEIQQEPAPNVSLDEVEGKLQNFILKYQLIINTTKSINRRILKAFPNFRSIDHEYPLKDVRDKLFKNRKHK